MKEKNTASWEIWIDTGGTFTDCIARDPSGRKHRVKVLSSSALRGTILEQIAAKVFRIEEKWSAPEDFIRGFEFKILDVSHESAFVESYHPAGHTLTLTNPLGDDVPANTTLAFEVRCQYEAPVLAARLVTRTPSALSLQNINMRLATTRGTNALLERKGAPTALFITRGFGDLLRIGTQQRPDIFALDIRKPAPLYSDVVEVDERLSSDGSVLQPLDLDKLKEAIDTLQRKGVRVAAVALMHSYCNSQHEQRLSEHILQKGFQHVSCSSTLAPFIKIVPRAETAVVDAYLAPIIGGYLHDVQSSMTGGRLHVMTSAGGLVQAEDFRSKDSLLSGPAGGVVGAALSGRRSGFNKIIAFDMGGTSTDVARFDGDYEYVFEHEVGDAHLVAPALAIESVAAGGGSICAYDGFRLQVGPQSASADPGPACYGAGGPLTLTDVNLLLGYLDPARFGIPISIKHAQVKFEQIRETLAHTQNQVESEALLQGFLDIANERMADAIRRVSVRKGYDPQDYALVAFGGAGGQHACGVARRLGVQTIIVPQDASLLSAYGIGNAVIERFAEKQILQSLDIYDAKLPQVLHRLTAEAQKAVATEGVKQKNIRVRRRIVNLRFRGQDSVLPVEYDDSTSLQSLFESRYQEIFGHVPEGRQIEIESVRVVCSSTHEPIVASRDSAQAQQAEAEGSLSVFVDDAWQAVPFYERSQLPAGARISGPALIFEQHSSTLVEPHWSVGVDSAGALVMKSE